MSDVSDGELLASAVHELKTPIAAVRGAAAALRGDSEALSPETRDRLLAVIVAAGDQLARLADDLMSASRGATSGPAVEPRPAANLPAA